MIKKASSTSGSYVLIVGAGPTGLTLANALATYGVPFTIIDNKPRHTSDSKGLTLNIASQYSFQLLGLKIDVGGSGQKVRRLNILLQQKKYCAIDFKNIKSPIHHFVTQPQSVTEEELLKALELRGHFVEWETRLTDVIQNEDCAEVVLENSRGERTTRSFCYVVGCDGKHSLIREKIAANFIGYDYAMHFVLGDFILNSNLAPAQDQVHYHVFNDTFIIFVPIGGGVWRVVVKYDGPVPLTEVQASDITNVVTKYLDSELIVGEPLWLSRAPFYNRTSDRLRLGRLFIAGDAAHLFSPIGGTGMNMGIQDALNLAWKVSFLYHNLSNVTLLDTYEAERHEAIVETAKITELSTRLITGQMKNHGLIGFMAPKMKNRSYIRNELPYRHSGVGLQYSHITLNGSDVSRYSEGNAGRLDLSLVELFKRTNFRHLPDKPHSYLALIRLPDNCNDEFIRQLMAMRTYLNRFQYLKKFFILSSESAFSELIIVDSDEYIVNADEQWNNLSNLGMGKIALIRPDGFTAFEGTLEDIDDLSRYLNSVFNADKESCYNYVSAAGDTFITAMSDHI